MSLTELREVAESRAEVGGKVRECVGGMCTDECGDRRPLGCAFVG